MFLSPRADSRSLSSDEDPGPSDKTTRIIVGVVVGGVAAIAITAGIIFFLIKKRKWDRIKQCEERLIDYQLTPGTGAGYSSKLNSRSVTPEDYQVYYPMTSPPPPTSTTAATAPAAYPYPQAQTGGQGQQDRPALGHRTRGMSAPASTTLSTLTTGQPQPQPQPQTRAQHLTPESPPPAYQTLHARYDPSRYSQVSTRFSSAFEGLWSSTSTVGNPNRNTRGYTVSGMLPTTPESSSWFQQQQQQQQAYQYQPGPAVSGSGSGPASTWTSSSGAVTTTASSSSNNNPSESTSEERGPRRPRPVLSRLITNL